MNPPQKQLINEIEDNNGRWIIFSSVKSLVF